MRVFTFGRLLPLIGLMAGASPLCFPAAETPAVQTQFRVFPRVLLGNGWETRIVLPNPGVTPVAFQQAFFSGGKPAPLAIRSDFLAESVTSSAIQGVLA